MPDTLISPIVAMTPAELIEVVPGTAMPVSLTCTLPTTPVTAATLLTISEHTAIARSTVPPADESAVICSYVMKIPVRPDVGGAGDVCACAGNITESTTGFDHESGNDLPATIAPLPAAIDFNNLRRFSLDFLSVISISLSGYLSMIQHTILVCH